MFIASNPYHDLRGSGILSPEHIQLSGCSACCLNYGDICKINYGLLSHNQAASSSLCSISLITRKVLVVLLFFFPYQFCFARLGDIKMTWITACHAYFQAICLSAKNRSEKGVGL